MGFGLTFCLKMKEQAVWRGIFGRKKKCPLPLAAGIWGSKVEKLGFLCLVVLGGNEAVDNDGDNAKDEEDEKEGPTGTTPKDKVIVFTYKAAVNKVDQDGKALPGAEFKLEKVLANGSKVELTLTKNAEGTVFTAVGLDDGNYVLTETVTPTGYNTIAPVEFTIGAEHELDSQDPKLVSLTGGDMFTGAIDTLTLTADVVNQAGTTLPETGGAGTTMIYVIGAVLVLGAGLVLVTKKRAA